MDYLGVVLLVAVVAIAFVVIARSSVGQGRRARAEQARQLALATRAAEADVNGFGDEVSRLAVLADDDPAAADLYDLVTALHSRALESLREARQPDELCQVTEILEEGRWAAARLAARAAGEPMPSRRPPCFFNPGHGPSTRNVTWEHRSVPACAADAARVEAGADPYIRTVERDDMRVPYWEGGPAYAGWARGYYSSWRGNRLVADIALTKV
ncbi:MAG: hypothetical protein QM619_10860 [Micropruina sp.]|uniref:hypothetical protein n=1 Tax=Micropruina sp. TaxID=2737536 RepID=UPI0039E234E1